MPKTRYTDGSLHDVLKPHKLKTYWQEVVYWVTAIFFSLGVIAVGVTMRNDNCEDEPGPCFFNYLSHWYYILFAVWFFLCGIARFSPLVRTLLLELQWFFFGSTWVWSTLTLTLLIITTRSTVEAMLPDDGNDTVGIHVVILLILHFISTIVNTFVFLPQYSEYLASYWMHRIEWIGERLTYAASAIYLLFYLFSPSILWILYLAIFDPVDVYNISIVYADSWKMVWFIGAGTLFFAQFFHGMYLHKTKNALIAHREKKYELRNFPRDSDKHATKKRIKRQKSAVLQRAVQV
jgi:hypothetical protein